MDDFQLPKRASDENDAETRINKTNISAEGKSSHVGVHHVSPNAKILIRFSQKRLSKFDSR